MVALANFVVRLSIAQVDAPDRPFALHHRDSAKDTRVVGRAEFSAHNLVHLIDGPRVSRVALEHVADGVGDGAGSGHIEIITAVTH